MDRGEKIEEKLIAYIKIHIPLKEKFFNKTANICFVHVSEA